jgi:hypothetical protein
MDPKIPRAGADTVEETLEGYYRASSGPEEQVTNEEVAEESEVSADTANRQKNFLASLGILNKDGYDYLTTETGIEVGKLFEFDKRQAAYDELRAVMLDWGPTDTLLEDIGDGSVSEKELFDMIEFATETLDARDNYRKQAGINGLIEWYDRTNILSQNDGRWTVSDNQSSVEPDDEHSEDGDAPSAVGKIGETVKSGETAQNSQQESSPGSVKREVRQVEPESGADVSIEVSLELSDESDPEAVKRVLRAVQEGLKTESEGDDESDEDHGKEGSDLSLTDFDG